MSSQRGDIFILEKQMDDWLWSVFLGLNLNIGSVNIDIESGLGVGAVSMVL
jgi:hypothetical protein